MIAIARAGLARATRLRLPLPQLRLPAVRIERHWFTRQWLVPRLIVIAMAMIAFGALYTFWLRDSSLVAVKKVKFQGLPEQADESLLAALESAAMEMTTLHVQPELLAEAAEPFPLIESVRADPDFPNTLTVVVTERIPAALIGEGESAIPVTDEGELLRSVSGEGFNLPTLPLSGPPDSDHLVGPVMDQVDVLGAAPDVLRPFIASSHRGPGGVVVQLDGGFELRFGSADRAAEKWRAAAAVLSDPELEPFDYVDLSEPNRPAVGGYGITPPPIEPAATPE